MTYTKKNGKDNYMKVVQVKRRDTERKKVWKKEGRKTYRGIKRNWNEG